MYFTLKKNILIIGINSLIYRMENIISFSFILTISYSMVRNDIRRRSCMRSYYPIIKINTFQLFPATEIIILKITRR